MAERQKAATRNHATHIPLRYTEHYSEQSLPKLTPEPLFYTDYGPVFARDLNRSFTHEGYTAFQH